MYVVAFQNCYTDFGEFNATSTNLFNSTSYSVLLLLFSLTYNTYTMYAVAFQNSYTDFGEFNPTSTNLFNAANVIWKFILHGQYQIVYFMVIYLYNCKSYNYLRNTHTNPYYG